MLDFVDGVDFIGVPDRDRGVRVDLLSQIKLSKSSFPRFLVGVDVGVEIPRFLFICSKEI